MRAVSVKRRRENVERRRTVDELYEAAPWCKRCGRGHDRDNLDAHEILSRARGGSITDKANIVLLCRPCHDYVTGNPEWAAAQGWALSQYSGGAS